MKNAQETNQKSYQKLLAENISLLIQIDNLETENQQLRSNQNQLPVEIYEGMYEFYSWTRSPALMAKHLNLIYREMVAQSPGVSDGEPLKEALVFFWFIIQGIEDAIHD